MFKKKKTIKDMEKELAEAKAKEAPDKKEEMYSGGVPKLEEAKAEELIPETDEVHEEIKNKEEDYLVPEEDEVQSVEQELFNGLTNLDQRVSKIESVLFRNLN